MAHDLNALLASLSELDASELEDETEKLLLDLLEASEDLKVAEAEKTEDTDKFFEAAASLGEKEEDKHELTEQATEVRKESEIVEIELKPRSLAQVAETAESFAGFYDVNDWYDEDE